MELVKINRTLSLIIQGITQFTIRQWTYLKYNLGPFQMVFYFLVILCFLISLFSSIYAPGFTAQNIISDIGFWGDNDPGAWYLQSAHEIFRKPPVYTGHPGIPLQVGNALVQKIIYFLFHGQNETYTACILRKIYLVQLFSRTLVTLIWILTGFLIKSLTERLFKDRDTGYIAGILFITSFPFLYYINRISPEPFMILFFLLSFYCIIIVQENCDLRQWKKTFWFSCAATSASVAAFYSKINSLGPFPAYIFFCLCIILFRKHSWKRMGVVLLFCMISAICTIICFEPFMDWITYAHDWLPFAPVGSERNMVGYQAVFYAGMNVLKQMGSVLSQFSFHDFLPFTDKSRMVFATEYSLILLYFLSFLFRENRQNKILMAMNLFIIFPTYIFLYRATIYHDFHGFHYLFPLLTVCCIQVAKLIRGTTSSHTSSSFRTSMGALLIVLIIHFTALLYGMNAHRIRIKKGQEARQVYLSLLTLKPGEKLPIKFRNSLSTIGITTGNLYNTGVPSLMEHEILKNQGN